jgi:hypothetical protein
MALRSYETTPVREVALSCALDLVNAGQILSVLGMSAYAALPPADLRGALAAVGVQKFLSLPADDQNRCFALAGLGV